MNGSQVIARTSSRLTDGRTHKQTQTTTIPEGRNWPRVKYINVWQLPVTFMVKLWCIMGYAARIWALYLHVNPRKFQESAMREEVIFVTLSLIDKATARSWASCQIRKIAGCACAGNAGNVSPRRRFQTKPLVSDPGMHHGTCVTHGIAYLWWRGKRSRHSRRMRTRNFAYLARGPKIKEGPNSPCGLISTGDIMDDNMFISTLITNNRIK